MLPSTKAISLTPMNAINTTMTSLEASRPTGVLSAGLARYRHGEPRARVFHDILDSDLRRFPEDAVVLDIGCGHGFDGDAAIQGSIARRAGTYIGIDPEARTAPSNYSIIYPCPFEQAPLRSSSVHLAFSVFVQEHLANPTAFWTRLYEVLVPGGVYWGFTVDARHFFSAASTTLEKLGIKDRYLDYLWGRRGVDRYENYPTHYLANTPRSIARYTRQFTRCAFASFHRIGQLASYFPRSVKPIVRAVERLTMLLKWPGSILLVRLEK